MDPDRAAAPVAAAFARSRLRTVLALGGGLVMAGSCLPSAPVPRVQAASAPVCLRIVDGIFDAPGDDRQNLGAEWIRIKNLCSETRTLGDWTVHDQNGEHVYRFAGDFGLGPHASVQLHSGAGRDTATDRYWGKAAGEVWDQAADERAYLRGASGKPVADWSAYTDRVMVGAGDIARCDSTGDTATSVLVDSIPGTVITMGDNAYDLGTPAQFADCYAPTWGRFLARTHPAPGNHDHYTANAAGYFGYFGAQAGPKGRGYYSYERGGWHVVALDSECQLVGGCNAGSVQEAWLRDDLAKHPADCTLAYWHRPRYSSGEHGSSSDTRDLWQALLDYGADLVLTGHDHLYERFAPQDANGRLDRANGMREFVVGTGGATHYHVATVRQNSELRHAGSYGVLRLDLRPKSYRWTFEATAGDPFTDSGKQLCH